MLSDTKHKMIISIPPSHPAPTPPDTKPASYLVFYPAYTHSLIQLMLFNFHHITDTAVGSDIPLIYK